MAKAYKATVSGSYRYGNKEMASFQNLEVILPYNDIDVVTQALIKRFVPMAILKDNKKYPDRLTSIREVFIDEMEEIDHNFSYIGKDIKKMDYAELMDLAAAFHIISIPLYQKASIRSAREKAYVAYSNMNFGTNYSHKDEDFDFMGLPPLKAEAGCKADRVRKRTNAEVLSGEVNPDGGRGRTEIVAPKETPSSVGNVLSLEELKQIADGKNISYNPQIGYDKLYARIFTKDIHVA